ncbi:MAG: hypothetical protein ACFB0C_05435 [Leptolyngbyaceae cyanobacterium]
MLIFSERRAELRKKLGRLDELPIPPVYFRTLLIRFWFEEMGDPNQFRTNKKMQLFCEAIIRKLNLSIATDSQSVDALCLYFCSEIDPERLFDLIEVSYWALGIVQKQNIKRAITRLNLALKTYDLPFEYQRGELTYKKG